MGAPYIMIDKPAPLRDLKTARENLSHRYASSRVRGFKNDLEREAYVQARMPATRAAIASSLKNIDTLSMPPIMSCLDVGCGPGTGTLALKDWMDTFTDASCHFTLLDQDRAILDYARAQCTDAGMDLSHLSFIQSNIITGTLPQADLVLLSYVLGEMERADQLRTLMRAFDAAVHFLVLVHPGTQSLFDDLCVWRNKLVEWGGFIVAPCPGHGVCPLSLTPDQGKHPTSWCHFKTRIARTRELKYLKNATLNFEDEPFNYLIISKQPRDADNHPARIITAPRQRTGHIYFHVCQASPNAPSSDASLNPSQNLSIASVNVSKKHPHYAQIKKKSWGDTLSEDA